MALKKGMFESYVKERQNFNVATKTPTIESAQYSHNRVFDEPASLKKAAEAASEIKNEEPTPTSSIPDIKIDSDLETENEQINRSVIDTKKPKSKKSLGNDRETIGEPLGNSIGEPLGGNKGTIREQKKISKNIQASHWGTIGEPIGEQNRGTIGEPLGNRNWTVSELTGNQRIILFYIVDSCVYRGQLCSSIISNETLRIITNSSADSVKTTIKRLIKKKMIGRIGGKRGNGGGAAYNITKEIRDAVLSEKRTSSIGEPLGNSIGEPLGNNRGTHRGTDKPSSSSFKDLETTTTELGLSDEWNFDIASYQKWGFGQSQLKQLASLSSIPANVVEQSLVEFNFDIENNLLLNIKTTKINYLMGLLRKGISYTSEAYLNDQEATIIEMSRRAASKKENVLKAKFEAWAENLNDEEIKEIEKKLPTHLIIPFRDRNMNLAPVKQWLFNYYVNKLD